MNETILQERNRIILAITLIVFGIVGRLTFYQFLPNTPSIYININGISQNMFMMDLFFIVALVSIIAGLLLGGYYTFIVPISVMIFTNLIIGNNLILLFTWSGFIILALVGYYIKQKKGLTLKSAPSIIGGSIVGVLIYDLWTNFGSWLGWYPKTISGLITCYTLSIPFTMWHLLSTTIAVSAVILPIVYLKEQKNLKIDFTVKSWENKPTIIASSVLIIASLLSVLI